jgi:hypothetical protein
MFDGVDAPAFVERAGTNPTALVQAGNLEVGSWNGGQLPFNGNLAQVAYFTAKPASQSTIVGYISQGLSGTEPSLGSAWSFDNSITDLNTTTPNDLTAQNGATAIAVDSPFAAREELAPSITAGTTEYAEITSVTFSTNTTVTARTPESCVIPTSGGVSAVSYSSQAEPYGLPYFSKILGQVYLTNNFTTSSTSDTAINGLSTTVVVPTGARIKVSVKGGTHYNATAGDSATIKVWEGAVASGTNIGGEDLTGTGGSTYAFAPANFEAYVKTSGTKTYNASLRSGAGGAAHLDTTATRQAVLTVELV